MGCCVNTSQQPRGPEWHCPLGGAPGSSTSRHSTMTCFLHRHYICLTACRYQSSVLFFNGKKKCKKDVLGQYQWYIILIIRKEPEESHGQRNLVGRKTNTTEASTTHENQRVAQLVTQPSVWQFRSSPCGLFTLVIQPLNMKTSM